MPPLFLPADPIFGGGFFPSLWPSAGPLDGGRDGGDPDGNAPKKEGEMTDRQDNLSFFQAIARYNCAAVICILGESAAPAAADEARNRGE